jgi:uncharacterized paraquat-inducible protein A
MITNSIKKSKTMKTKILITTIALGLFTVSTMQAQEKKHDDTKHEHMDMAKDKAMYTCSMHPEVKSDKPGECPKCGMELKKMAKAYTCSMHPEVKSDKPGECPKCGMKMVEKKMDMKKKKDEAHNEHKH